ncbi:cellulose-binding domain-containing protein [Streptomyces sp. NBRC 110028]|uniref:cellulose-binding domain-containing protein n=1 Tax=Streptomyces sp. NBRC 110028 TaxID=1621260 RepID=UPI0006E1FAB2|nr:cellulose-binding domain-containing protein [Streptomyces sp. NBRC 110028]
MPDHSASRDGAFASPGQPSVSAADTDAVSPTALLNLYWDAVADYADLCTTTPEDGMRLATEAFRRGIRAARNRRARSWGPRLPWLPLLLTSVRKTAADWHTHRDGDRLDPELRVWLSSTGVARYAVPPREQPLALRGLRDLGEHDGALLWSVEVESQPVEAVAWQLGGDIGYATEEIARVRAAFRQRCQRNHLDTLTHEECRSYAKLLDAATRSPDAHSPADLWQHLARCRNCREAAACLYLHGGGLPNALAGGVLGWGGHGYVARRRRAVERAPGATPAPPAPVSHAVRVPLRDRVLDKVGGPLMMAPRLLRQRLGPTGRRRAVHGMRRARTATVALAVVAVVALAMIVTLTRTAAVSGGGSGEQATGRVTRDTTAPGGTPSDTTPVGTKAPGRPGTSAEPSSSRGGDGVGGKAGKDGREREDRDEGKGNKGGKGDQDGKRTDPPASPPASKGSGEGHEPSGGSSRKPPGEPACTARYDLVTEWPDGFKAEVTLTSRSALDTWRVSWEFPDDQRVTQMWNGAFTQRGSTVTTTPADYNHRVDANKPFSVGFLATRQGRNSPPRAFTLNGERCSA